LPALLLAAAARSARSPFAVVRPAVVRFVSALFGLVQTPAVLFVVVRWVWTIPVVTTDRAARQPVSRLVQALVSIWAVGQPVSRIV
jgi:hypothetical protein